MKRTARVFGCVLFSNKKQDPNILIVLLIHQYLQIIAMKVVIVGTSSPTMAAKHPTGVWIGELASPYYIFKDAGYEVIIASPKGKLDLLNLISFLLFIFTSLLTLFRCNTSKVKYVQSLVGFFHDRVRPYIFLPSQYKGGPIPIDQGSLTESFFTDSSKKFMHDATAIGMLCHSTPIADIDFSSDVDAIFLAGGHGACDDFSNCAALKSAIETMYEAKKVVSAICHGPVGLADCKKSDGTPLVNGLTVTGFSNSEEDAVQLSSMVPFLLETKFKEQGAEFEKADDWQSKVCVDGNLVTGQNPQSVQDTAKAVVTLLSS